MKQRFKWEPAALMVLVLALGAWLVWTGKNRLTGIKPLPTSTTVEMRLGNTRGVVEIDRTLGSPRVRTHVRGGRVGEWHDPSVLTPVVGEAGVQELVATKDNLIFRLFNITNWANLGWVVLGLGGQIVFSARFLVQWLVSEKERKSVIPPIFWWFSLGGGVLLFTYFVWRQDFVGVLGQSSGLVIYARNLKLIAKQRKREGQLGA